MTLDLIFQRLWLPLKGIYRKKYTGKLSYTTSIAFTQKYGGKIETFYGHSSVIDTAVTKIGVFFANTNLCSKRL
jgi:hypothetical protein